MKIQLIIPIEISRATNFYWTEVQILITSTSEHGSPHIQRSKEIPCKVTVTIPGTCRKLILMERYQKLIKESSTESKYENIVILYLHPQEEREGTREA